MKPECITNYITQTGWINKTRSVIPIKYSCKSSCWLTIINCYCNHLGTLSDYRKRLVEGKKHLFHWMDNIYRLSFQFQMVFALLLLTWIIRSRDSKFNSRHNRQWNINPTRTHSGKFSTDSPAISRNIVIN